MPGSDASIKRWGRAELTTGVDRLGTMTLGARAMQVNISERLESTVNYPLWRVVVTTVRGRCYSCTFAGDKPSEEHVLHVWRTDRTAFDLIKTTTGVKPPR